MRPAPGLIQRMLRCMWSQRYYWGIPLALISLLLLVLTYLAREAGHSRLYPL